MSTLPKRSCEYFVRDCTHMHGSAGLYVSTTYLFVNMPL
jgi:hypothetical protein